MVGRYLPFIAHGITVDLVVMKSTCTCPEVPRGRVVHSRMAEHEALGVGSKGQPLLHIILDGGRHNLVQVDTAGLVHSHGALQLLVMLVLKQGDISETTVELHVQVIDYAYRIIQRNKKRGVLIRNGAQYQRVTDTRFDLHGAIFCVSWLAFGRYQGTGERGRYPFRADVGDTLCQSAQLRAMRCLIGGAVVCQIKLAHPLRLLAGAAAHALTEAPGPSHWRISNMKCAAAWVEQVRSCFALSGSIVLASVRFVPDHPGKQMPLDKVLVERGVGFIPYI